ncbi:response regulator transcription factor [Streptomyces sp. NPDC005811]|uniref:helix-turn-helix transcriptional regulator n=1 Tax=Streptomyces sp. NPDC005811 TaxID=3154565 RepID=UPI0033C40C31
MLQTRLTHVKGPIVRCSRFPETTTTKVDKRSTRASGVIDVIVACDDQDWPYRRWLQQNDTVRLREIQRPFADAQAGPGQVVLLRSHKVRSDIAQLLGVTGERPLPILLISQVTDGREVPTAFRLGVHGCLVEGDYQGWTLKNALWSTAAGHTHLSPVAAATLAQAGASAGPDGTDSWRAEVLSPRERQIMGLLTQGCRTTEIGHRLSISTKTVRNNLSTIYTKLGVFSRTEAVIMWLDAGLHLVPGQHRK